VKCKLRRVAKQLANIIPLGNAIETNGDGIYKAQASSKDGKYSKHICDI